MKHRIYIQKLKRKFYWAKIVCITGFVVRVSCIETAEELYEVSAELAQ